MKSNKPFEQHADHEAYVLKCQSGPHPAEYRCRTCNQHVGWMSKQDFKIWQRLPHTLASATRHQL